MRVRAARFSESVNSQIRNFLSPKIAKAKMSKISPKIAPRVCYSQKSPKDVHRKGPKNDSDIFFTNWHCLRRRALFKEIIKLFRQKIGHIAKNRPKGEKNWKIGRCWFKISPKIASSPSFFCLSPRSAPYRQISPIFLVHRQKFLFIASELKKSPIWAILAMKSPIWQPCFIQAQEIHRTTDSIWFF